MADESALNAALRQFEIAEANLDKTDKVLQQALARIPDGISFGSDPEYEDRCRAFDDLWKSLPTIGGWKPQISLPDLNGIAQSRLDAMEIGEPELEISISLSLEEPSKILREYRYRFNKARKDLVRDGISAILRSVDTNLQDLSATLTAPGRPQESVDDSRFEEVKELVDQLDFLLGSSVARPPRWSDLRRHLHFGLKQDLHDILKNDWPSIKGLLGDALYTDTEPIPLHVQDLSDIINQRPGGKVVTKLSWDRLSQEDFERLVFALISSESDYENPAWLTKTNAPDRGRDLSADRVHFDSLGGTIRQRIIIQCKHWLSRPIGSGDIATLREQMKLWEPPRVDIHVIATSGRFSADAVAWIEKHNQSDSALRIEMWPESHLERLLANRPSVIAEFRLR